MRTKGSKNRSKEEIAAAKAEKELQKAEKAAAKQAVKNMTSAFTGNNGGPSLTDDQAQLLLFQNKKKIAALKERMATTVADMRYAYKTAKADGFSKKDIDLAIACEDDEDGVLDRMKREHQIAKWMGHPAGTQFELFEGPDRTPLVDRAYDAGKRAGLAAEACSPPHSQGTPAYEPWMKGWHDGQAVNAAGIKPTLSPDDDGGAFEDALEDASDSAIESDDDFQGSDVPQNLRHEGLAF